MPQQATRSNARRVLLFVPGHRESMVAKAASIDADAIIFDLEDSVPVGEKAAARECVSRALAGWPSDAPAPFVRLNAPRYGMVEADAAAALAIDNVGIVVPKVDRPVELGAVFDAFGTRERELIVNIETPRSLLHAEEFADTYGVDGLFLGGEDLTGALGTVRTTAGDELALPRLMVLAAARAAGIEAYDTVLADFRDLSALDMDARTAAAMGFDGKFAIHPAQIPVIRGAFTPSEAEVEQAGRVVSAYDAALQRGEGAVAVDGRMVDPPVAERARAVLRRAGSR